MILRAPPAANRPAAPKLSLKSVLTSLDVLGGGPRSLACLCPTPRCWAPSSFPPSFLPSNLLVFLQSCLPALLPSFLPCILPSLSSVGSARAWPGLAAKLSSNQPQPNKICGDYYLDLPCKAKASTQVTATIHIEINSTGWPRYACCLVERKQASPAVGCDIALQGQPSYDALC